MNKKKQQNQGGKSKGANGWDALIEFFTFIRVTINSGQIFPIILLVTLLTPLVAVFRMKPDDIGPSALRFLEFAGGHTILILTLVASNIAWYLIFRLKRRECKEEIGRLTKERSKLMHEPPEKKIERHRSTRNHEDIKPKMIVPGSKKKASKRRPVSNGNRDKGET